MSVLVYTSSSDGKFKKSAFEVVSFGKKVAEELGTNLIALAINAEEVSELQTYGAESIVTVMNDQLTVFNANNSLINGTILNNMSYDSMFSKTSLYEESFKLNISKNKYIVINL